MFYFIWAGIFILISVVVINLISIYKIYEKAGYKGWIAYIPIYNMMILFKITNISYWAFLLSIIPIVNFVLSIKISIRLAKAFNKRATFGLGLMFIPLIFYPILAFGKSEYKFNVSSSKEKPLKQKEELIEVEEIEIMEIDLDVDNHAQSLWHDSDKSAEDNTVVISEPGEQIKEVKREKLVEHVDLSNYKLCSNCGNKCLSTAETCFLCGKKL